MNEILWLLMMITCFAGILLFYKFFGKTGLFIWIVLATIISNIQTVKLINLFGIETSLGNILYGTSFLATDIINLKYGAACARKSILYAFSSMIFMAVIMQFCLLYNPSANDFASESLNVIFTFNIRITIASLVAFVISQLIDSHLFNKLQTKYNKLWLSNNASTIVCQLIDTVIFVTITYIGVVTLNSMLQLMISMYIFKFIVALCDTPFIYIANKISTKE